MQLPQKSHVNAWFSTEMYPGLCLSIPHPQNVENNISTIFQKNKRHTGHWKIQKGYYVGLVSVQWTLIICLLIYSSRGETGCQNEFSLYNKILSISGIHCHCYHWQMFLISCFLFTYNRIFTGLESILCGWRKKQ